MTFASLEFGVLLAVTFGLYYFLPQRGRMLLLLAASYIFYCYWNPVYGLLIFASTVIDYSMAIAISKAKTQRLRKVSLVTSIIGNLGMLAYFKYTDFAIGTLKALLGPLGQNMPGPLELILPVGISFYTFQTMSYTIDVYRGKKEAEYDFLLLSLYVSFFPQLVAGPIERAGDLIPQLKARQPFSLQHIEEGGRLIMWGLLKKLVISDRLTYAAYPAFLDPAAYSTGELFFSSAAMAVVVYLDFSAYSEIARGVARLFGIRLTVNFRFPLSAGNVAEFWRRWHISMSTWVRDYLFKPLGGFRPRNLWHHSRTTLITMGLVGLWHGAQWTFVLWGLSIGVLLVLYRILRIYVLKRYVSRSVLESLPWRFGSWMLTIFIRLFTIVLFFSPDFERSIIFYDRLFFHSTAIGFDRPYIILGFALLAAFYVSHYIHSRIPISSRFDMRHPAVRGGVYAVLLFMILFGAVDTAEEFIYFQF